MDMGLGKVGRTALRQLGGQAKQTYKDANYLGNWYSDKGSWVADKAVKGLIKKTTPSLANAYTGLGPTKLATGLFAAGAAGYAGYKTISGDHRSKIDNGQNDFVGTAPILSGDGIGNKSSAPTLGASGSLVFGLHNRR